MVKTGQKGRGRPAIENKLGIQIFTRIDAATNKKLEAASARIDRAQSWVIRKALLEWLDRNATAAIK